MTLFRVLTLSLTLLLIALFTGSFALTVNGTRFYLQEQLNTHAQDTATSLGVAIAANHENNAAVIDSLIDAVFDSGYYRQIRFTDMHQKVVINSEHPLTMQGVPDWFVRLVNLQAPRVSSEINRGWQPLGQLLVVSHPGYAYRSLWSKVINDGLLFSGALMLAIVGLNILLSVVLRPLKRMEKQANRICERHFDIQPTLPKTRDLRRVVEAMNRMAEKLETAFTEKVALSEVLQRNSIKDPLTELLNAKAFTNLMRDRLTATGGSLAVIQIAEHATNPSFADDMLIEVSQWLLKTLQPWPQAFAARLDKQESRADFAIFMPACSVDENRKITEQLFKTLVSVPFFCSADGANSLRIASVTCTNHCKANFLLDLADGQLLKLSGQVKNCWDVTDVSTESHHVYLQWSDAQWQENLQTLTANNTIELYGQPIVDVNGTVAFTEVLATLNLAGERVPAEAFLPIIERHGLHGELDRAVFLALMNHMDNLKDYARYCLNISPHSLLDENFHNWLLDALKLRPDLTRRLILEVPERAILLMGQTVAQRMQALMETGCQFSVDHFGIATQALTFLQIIPAHYLKLDSSFTRSIAETYENQLYIRTLAMLADSRDIIVLAHGIENDAEWALLKELGVRGGQGYALGMPERI